MLRLGACELSSPWARSTRGPNTCRALTAGATLFEELSSSSLVSGHQNPNAFYILDLLQDGRKRALPT
jgi:hypothetical protein